MTTSAQANKLEQSPPGAARGRVLGSAMKCLALIDLLAEESGPVRITDLANRLGMQRGTLHQQLRTLAVAGWVEADEHSRYRLTLHALTIGTAMLERANLGSRILPTLTTLAAKTGETAAVAVLDRDVALIVQRVAADRELKVDIKPGTRMPLANSASGRVLIAFAQSAELDRARALGAQLPASEIVDAARHAGYAVQLDEWIPGMSSIAVSIMPTHLGSCAVSITAPSSRFNQAVALTELRRAVQELEGLPF